MKSLLAKTLTSATLVLATFAAAHAYSGKGSPQPATEDHYWRTPASDKYWEERAARAPVSPTSSVNDRDRFPSTSTNVQVYQTPDQIRYWKQRNAELEKAAKERPSKPDEFFPKFQWN
jgi:hypothetical protein